MGPIGSVIFGALFDVLDAKVIFRCTSLLLLVCIAWLMRTSKIGRYNDEFTN
ncbi:MAG TPA: hypothetical protein VNU45_06950 [Rummeliibacillus sp.]|nr:hypothetical protein [Rummeliibacillus sp.]